MLTDLSSLNWDDLRFVLAVADAGSVNGAARRLDVNHATVLRRIDSIEKHLGHPLFDKHRSGYRATGLGLRLVECAQQMREQIMSLQTDGTISDAVAPSGLVRLATTDSLLQSVVAPVIAAFCRQHPQIDVQFMASNHRVAVEDHGADIAVRATRQPPERVTATSVCPVGLGLYVPRHWSAAAWQDIDPGATWLSLNPAVPSPTHFWMQSNFPSARINIYGDSFMSLVQLASHADAALVLPCCVGDDLPTHRRIGDPLDEIVQTLFVLAPADLLVQPRVRLLYDGLVTGLRDQAPRISGLAA